MKFNFKNLAAIFIISALIPLGVAHSDLLFNPLRLPDDPQNQHYIAQIKDRENTIINNKNKIEELILDIKSKETEFLMAVNSTESDEDKIVRAHKQTIKEDEKNAKELFEKIDSLKSKIKEDIKNKDYSTLLKDMSTLISAQQNSHNLLQKLNVDLDKSLNTLQ